MTLIYFKGDRLADYEDRELDFLRTNEKSKSVTLLGISRMLGIKPELAEVLFGMFLEHSCLAEERMTRRFVSHVAASTADGISAERMADDVIVGVSMADDFITKATEYISDSTAEALGRFEDYKDDDEDEEQEKPDEQEKPEEQERDALDKVRYNVHGQFEGYREIAKVLLDKFEVEAVDMKLDEVMSNPHFSEILDYVLLVRGINGDRVSMYKFNCYFNTRTHVTGGYELLKI